jgi:hypothetical protein
MQANPDNHINKKKKKIDTLSLNCLQLNRYVGNTDWLWFFELLSIPHMAERIFFFFIWIKSDKASIELIILGCLLEMEALKSAHGSLTVVDVVPG